jgi:DNA-binding transcriptional LysR family regulator
LRDLRVFLAVLEAGSLAKAAATLRVTPPAVSQVIADLEHSLGVRLFDRSPRGAEPTVYADALLKRSRAAFDELKEGIRDIEFLADPTSGEVRIGSVETVSATILPEIVRRFSERYPRVALHVADATAPAAELPGLLDRRYDLILVRLVQELTERYLPDDFVAESVFEDQLRVVAGRRSKWASRRKIALADLAGEPWIMAPPGTWNHTGVADAFHAEGLHLPKPALVSVSMALRVRLLADGPFIAALPDSVLRLNQDHYTLKVLPVALARRPWPIVIVTLKNRTLSPVVARFIACIREVGEAIDSHTRDVMVGSTSDSSR